MIATDTDLCITTWNPAAEAMYGWHSAEALGRPLHELLRARFEGTSLQAARAELLRNGFWRGRVTHTTREGRELLVLAHVALLTDGAGNRIGGVTINQDITTLQREREHMQSELRRQEAVARKEVARARKAERALKESEELFRGLFEQSSLGIAIVSQDGFGFVRVNEAMARITGYSARELVGMGIADITHPEDWERQRSILEEVARGERRRYTFEKRYRRKDDALRWVRVTADVISGNREDGVLLGIIEDITESRQLHEELTRQGARLRQAQHAARLGSYEYDLRDSRVLWGDEVFEILGRDPALGVPSMEEYYRIVHPEDSEQVRRLVESCIGSSVELDHEYRIRTDQGEIRWVHSTGNVARDAQGLPRTLFGTVQDVSARKRMERDLREYAVFRATATLAGGLAHDINNLMVAVIGNAEMLELAPGASDSETVRQIVQAAYKASELTERLLAFAGVSHYDPQPLSISTLLESAVAAIHVPPRIRLVSELPPGLPTVCADATLLRMMLREILSNAVEAIVDNGLVRITARQIEDRVHVVVADTGRGMDGPTVERVTEPMFSTKFAGRGMGMAVAQGVVERHEGRLRITSRPGEGTTVQIELPLRR